MGQEKVLLPRKDRSGSRYGNWLLLSISDCKRYPNKKGSRNSNTVIWYYSCRCDCGTISRVSWTDIGSGKSTQCRECHLHKYILNSQKGIKNFGKKNPNYRGSENIPHIWLSRAKKNAEIRSLPFEITLSDMQRKWDEQKGLCFYSGLPLSFSKDGTMKDTNIHLSLTASLDRLDSSIGYFPHNIAWTSKTINRVKMNLPHETFLKMCEIVFKHNTKN